MKRFHIIYMADSKVVLSSVAYQDWREIQDSYRNYITSVDIDTLEEVVDYLVIEHKLTRERSRELVEPINGSPGRTVELDL